MKFVSLFPNFIAIGWTEVLDTIVFLNLQILYGTFYDVFHQDGAAVQTANVFQNWCKDKLTDFFFTNNEWPPGNAVESKLLQN